MSRQLVTEDNCKAIYCYLLIALAIATLTLGSIFYEYIPHWVAWIGMSILFGYYYMLYYYIGRKL